jgi:hypothetical protein
MSCIAVSHQDYGATIFAGAIPTMQACLIPGFENDIIEFQIFGLPISDWIS